AAAMLQGSAMLDGVMAPIVACRATPLRAAAEASKSRARPLPCRRRHASPLPDLRRLLRLLPRQLPLVRGRCLARRHGADRADRAAAPPRTGHARNLATLAALRCPGRRDRRAFALQPPPGAAQREIGSAPGRDSGAGLG